MDAQPNGRKLEELDLTILNMTGEEGAKRASRYLEGVPGIVTVRLMDRGAFVRYDAHAITKDQICDLLHHGALRAGVYQDSKTGATGKASQ